jgi:hypothetical protein
MYSKIRREGLARSSGLIGLIPETTPVILLLLWGGGPCIYVYKRTFRHNIKCKGEELRGKKSHLFEVAADTSLVAIHKVNWHWVVIRKCSTACVIAAGLLANVNICHFLLEVCVVTTISKPV